MSKKSNIEDFVKRANIIHNNKYDYAKCDYINNHTKVIIICNHHGIFEQQPKNHLNKDGCPSCKGSRARAILSKGKKYFVEEANQIHNNKYDYSKF